MEVTRAQVEELGFIYHNGGSVGDVYIRPKLGRVIFYPDRVIVARYRERRRYKLRSISQLQMFVITAGFIINRDRL